MPVFRDQMNRPVEIHAAPQRIISLVPSQTELLFDLGLDEAIAGLTKYCVHPHEQVRFKTRVGGTKQLQIDLIRGLNPDLIIGNKEENEKSQIDELSRDFPVWLSDITNLAGALDMIKGLGRITDKSDRADRIADQIAGQFSELTIKGSGLKVAYFIWRKPYMVAGKGTFIDDMLQTCGLTNAFEMERYPEITAVQLMKANPEVIFLSSEPYPFKAKHIPEFQSLLPLAAIKIVDGEMFSWYGSRLLHAPAYFRRLGLID